ncbi:MAG: prepilin-type N-terminal cleavage/methylation domain-containing protein [Candidatus Omnitrophica bacterium]|nr:prepilin-type N-terminal cleavage/methylation domain-containing protein [Candidatus Omnitrophota bacterium]
MKKAFTLTELMIVLVLLSIFIGGVMLVFVTQLKVWGSSLNRAAIRQQGHQALGRMVRELNQTNSITSASSSAITFLADLDDNGTDETITLNTSGNNLNRTEGAVISPLAFNVQSFGLTYYDSSNNVLTPPAGTDTQAERDTIKVAVLALTMSKADETLSISSSAYLHNQ